MTAPALSVATSTKKIISVFGLGYVGTVTAACLAHLGHEVVGIDNNVEKVDLVNKGKAPILEQHLEGLISDYVGDGRIAATTISSEAIIRSDISIVCVGTPSKVDQSGSQLDEVDLNFLRVVCRDIGNSLKSKDKFHVVIVRSTIPPGTTRGLILPEIESASGKSVGEGFGLVFNPEFMREGTAVDDFFNPPKTIIGEIDKRGGEEVARMFEGLSAPTIHTTAESAEMIKYTDNVWHALKICFANEVGSICKALEINSRELMEIFCKDTKLNISPAYLKPGFAFGGSCLPKDVRAMSALANKIGLNTPLVNSILPSNFSHVERALNIIRNLKVRQLGFLGLSFKSGTDDVRESPTLTLIELLQKEGFAVKIYDENLSYQNLVGGNKEYLLKILPNIAHLLIKDPSHLKDMDAFVVSHRTEAYSKILQEKTENQRVVDLAIPERDTLGRSGCYRIC